MCKRAKNKGRVIREKRTTRRYIHGNSGEKGKRFRIASVPAVHHHLPGRRFVYQAKGVEMAFYQFPSVTAMFIAVLLAFCMGKGSIDEKFAVFAKGAANENVLTMLIIFILAGA